MSNSIIVGAAIEDSYISAGLVNLETRQLIDSTLRRKKVNPQGEITDIITNWSNVLNEVISLLPSGEKRIGMGVPGPCDYESGFFLNNNRNRYGSLYRLNLKELLADHVGVNQESNRLINDAACFFQGEVFGGAIRGYKKSFGITLGVGLGSARYVNGKVEDANLWKMPFKDSIAEDYLSVRWLINGFKTLSGIEVTDLVEMKRFAPDARVQQVFDEFADNLSEFLVEIIRKENPEVVLIGGQMESSNRFFFARVVEGVLAQGIKTPVMKAILGERASVIGAASVWYDQNLLHTK